MNQMTEREMTTSVSQVAQNLGYKVEMEPSTRHWRNLRRSYLSPINFGRVLRPDLLVSYGDQSVVVEIKNTGVLFGGVEQVLLYAKVFNAAGVLCMPDDAYSDGARKRFRVRRRRECFDLSNFQNWQCANKLVGSARQSKSGGHHAG